MACGGTIGIAFAQPIRWADQLASLVMRGLDPRIHLEKRFSTTMDCRA
jgi:hypothetical protein